MDIIVTNTLPPKTDGSSCCMYAILIAWFLLNIRETYNKTDIRKAKYWFANKVMNMADEQSKNNGTKVMERRVETI